MDISWDDVRLFLAIAPEGVRPGKLAEADDPDRTCGCVFAHPVNRTSLNGVTGKPSDASLERGAQLFDWLVEDLSDLVTTGRRELPPLPRSYYSPYTDDSSEADSL